MKCFKHLCAKLFLCLVFLGFWGFALNVNAAEMDTTGTAEVDAAMEAMTANTQAALAEAEATMAAMQATAALETTTVLSEEQTVASEAVATQPPQAMQDALAAAYAEARAQDVDRLSRIIQPEGGRTFEDKVCVGLTVLHRKDSPKYPNTVEENINAPGQYTKPTKGEVLPENLMAAECAMRLWESGLSYAVLPEGFLYFVGNGRDNKFHDFHGHYLKVSDIRLDIVAPYNQGPDGALIS